MKQITTLSIKETLNIILNAYWPIGTLITPVIDLKPGEWEISVDHINKLDISTIEIKHKDCTYEEDGYDIIVNISALVDSIVIAEELGSVNYKFERRDMDFNCNIQEYELLSFNDLNTGISFTPITNRADVTIEVLRNEYDCVIEAIRIYF